MKKKINLVIQTAFLGDLLLSIPLLRQIKKMYPQDEIGLVCKKGLGEIFCALGLVDHVFEISKGNQKSYEQVISEIDQLSLRNIYSPHQSLRTAFFVRRLLAENKIGFRRWWNFNFFDLRIPFVNQMPDALRQLSLCQIEDPVLEKNLQNYMVKGTAYQLSPDGQISEVPDWAKMGLREHLLDSRHLWSKTIEKFGFREGRKKALLFPGSVWFTKQWTEKGFVEVGQSLSQDYDVVIMGGPGEEALCSRISSLIPGSQNLCGRTTIMESLFLVLHSAFIICNDSASGHLAAVAETPSISIFGPTILEFGFRPWQNKAWIVQNLKLSCRPCGPHGHQKCPLGTHECMTSVSSLTVYQAVQKIYSSSIK